MQVDDHAVRDGRPACHSTIAWHASSHWPPPGHRHTSPTCETGTRRRSLMHNPRRLRPGHAKHPTMERQAGRQGPPKAKRPPPDRRSTIRRATQRTVRSNGSNTNRAPKPKGPAKHEHQTKTNEPTSRADTTQCGKGRAELGDKQTKPPRQAITNTPNTAKQQSHH